MISNRFALAALAVACLAAAAGGGYLANRQNAVPAPAAAQSAPASSVSQPAADAATAAPVKPVQETEAVVGDTPATSTPKAEPPKSTASTARRSDSPSRPEARTDARASASSSSPSRRTNQSPAVGTITSTWPSSASANGASQPPQPPTPPTPPSSDSSLSRPSDVPERAPEPVHPPEPPKPTFEELVVSADSVLGLQTENRISSETAHVEDRVDAKVTRDVKVGDRIAIPAGSRVLGSVTQVDQGGKFKEQARLGIRFHTIVLADGTRVPISTETIMRYGEAPGNSSAAKIGGGAVGGAILGAILGGGKGAAIGATAGAGAGTAAVMATDKKAAVLQPGTPVTARILTPVTVTVEK